MRDVFVIAREAQAYARRCWLVQENPGQRRKRLWIVRGISAK
jgi:hypothetical protein